MHRMFVPAPETVTTFAAACVTVISVPSVCLKKYASTRLLVALKLSKVTVSDNDTVTSPNSHRNRIPSFFFHIVFVRSAILFHHKINY